MERLEKIKHMLMNGEDFRHLQLRDIIYLIGAVDIGLEFMASLKQELEFDGELLPELEEALDKIRTLGGDL